MYKDDLVYEFNDDMWLMYHDGTVDDEDDFYYQMHEWIENKVIYTYECKCIWYAVYMQCANSAKGGMYRQRKQVEKFKGCLKDALAQLVTLQTRLAVPPEEEDDLELELAARLNADVARKRQIKKLQISIKKLKKNLRMAECKLAVNKALLAWCKANVPENTFEFKFDEAVINSVKENARNEYQLELVSPSADDAIIMSR